MSIRTAICTLPGGYVDDSGGTFREAEIVPLNGRDEELLAAAQPQQSSAHLVTTLLSRSVRRIGRFSPVSEDMARNLLVGDRQYLLLQLRELTFGPDIQGTVACPWPDCGKRVDMDFSIGDIPVKEAPSQGLLHQMHLPLEEAIIDRDGIRHQEVLFRLPTGADQECLAPALAANEARALSILLGRCIQRIGSIHRPGMDLIDDMTPRVRMFIEEEMQRKAPGIQLAMAAECTECRRQFVVPFQIQDFLFGELGNSLDLLYREVHYLAYYYHWSEREILDLPRVKRRRYIDTLTDELERTNNAVA